MSTRRGAGPRPDRPALVATPPFTPSRRQVLQGIGSTILAPAIARATTSPDVADPRRRTHRRKVGIIGGVSAAWLLDGAYDVVLFEAEPTVGGHAHTVNVDYGGRLVAADVGAQNFSPLTHPTYSKLLELLGFFDPTDLTKSPTVTVPLSLSVYAPGGANPLFVSPYLPDRTWPLTEPWNGPGVAAFATLIAAAQQMERDDLDWNVTVEQWVESTTIARDQKDTLVYPFLAALNDQNVEAGKALSARAGVYFVSRALSDNLFAGVTYYNSIFGIGGIVQRIAEACTTLTVVAGAPVERVTPAGGRYRITTRTVQEVVDHLVVATPPYIAAQLVRPLPHGGPAARVLQSFPYYRTTMTLHTDPVFVPPDRMHWSFENVEVTDGWGQGCLWYGAVHAPLPDGSTVDVFKSWTTHREDVAQKVLHREEFMHALPVPDFLRAQAALAALQGRHRTWFVGSHCIEVDSQDTALRSAMRVADALAPASANYVALKAMLTPAPG